MKPRATLAAGALALMLLAAIGRPAAPAGAVPFELHEPGVTHDSAAGVTLLGALDLTPLRAAHPALAELSGLAWDADAGVLYAVSDRGWLVHIVPVLSGGRLVDARIAGTHPLRGADGQALAGAHADAEGLWAVNARNGVAGDTELVVSFERRPRIERYAPDGRRLGVMELAPALRDRRAYAGANKGLEAVTVSADGAAWAAPEFPLRGAAQDRVTVYGPRGPVFTLPRLAATNAGLVALERLPDGRVLTLERAHHWLTLSLKVSLRLSDSPPARPGAPLTSTELALLDSALGWRVDNFEGLARHAGRRFFMVSDDNGQPLLSTLLAYFELRR